MTRVCNKTTDVVICYENDDLHCDICIWNDKLKM